MIEVRNYLYWLVAYPKKKNPKVFFKKTRKRSKITENRKNWCIAFTNPLPKRSLRICHIYNGTKVTKGFLQKKKKKKIEKLKFLSSSRHAFL